MPTHYDPREWALRYRQARHEMQTCRRRLSDFSEEHPVEESRFMRHRKSRNPELLLVGLGMNPGGSMRRRKHSSRRKVGKNFPITGKYRGKKYTWKSFLKKLKLPVKKAVKVWKKLPKFHGRTRVSVFGGKKRRKSSKRRAKHHTKRFKSRAKKARKNRRKKK